mgnify:CR=1 FL=1
MQKKTKGSFEDDIIGIFKQKSIKKSNDKKKTTTKMGKSPGALGGKLVATGTKGVERPKKKGKVDVGLQEALKKQKKKTKGKVDVGLQEALKKQKKKKTTPTKTKPKKPTIVTKEQLEKSGLSLRDYMNFLQGKTRRDDPKPKKVKLTKDQMPKRKPVMVDDFKKAKVKKKSKKTSAKTGLGSKAMSTKTPKKYKGTNITPTKLQRERMRKRMMGST